MIQRNYRVISILIVTALILACAPTFAPASTPPPAFDPNSLSTAIVLTANAAATQTAFSAPPTLTPTITSLPTSTLSPSETPTATFILVFFTPTVPTSTPTVKSTAQTGSGTGTPGVTNTKYACALISQRPADYTTFKPKADFDVTWEVKNTGTESWDAATTDFRYVGGDALQKQDVYPFTQTIASGKSISLGVDMTAPKAFGTYSTTWKIFVGKTSFCVLTMTLAVQ